MALLMTLMAAPAPSWVPMSIPSIPMALVCMSPMETCILLKLSEVSPICRVRALPVLAVPEATVYLLAA